MRLLGSTKSKDKYKNLPHLEIRSMSSCNVINSYQQYSTVLYICSKIYLVSY